MKLITLTTDFGTKDWFVGTMKGVIHNVNPQARIVDITHEIAPGDIRAGAFSLMAATPHFPPGCIHVAIVDPGVGGERRAVAIKTRNAIFVGPDNGLLSWASRNENVLDVRQIKNSRLFRQPVSRTFHGRDIFSPAAAHLARGVKFESIGPQISDWQRIPWPEPAATSRSVTGEILHIDRFGNAITSLPHDLLDDDCWSKAMVTVKSRKLGAPQPSYSMVSPGKPLAILSSSGFLEIAVNSGSAQELFQLKIGTRVTVRH